MSYVEKNLIDGEEIVYRSSLHKIVFLRPVFLLVLGIAMLTYTTVALRNEAGLFGLTIGGALAGFGVLNAIGSWIAMKSNEYAVTNLRVILKQGLFSRRTSEMLLKKIESIDVSQGILGRVLGYGTITLSGAGGSKDPYTRIDDPLKFRKVVQERTAEM